MAFSLLLVFTMALFATSAALAFAWSASQGHFRNLSAQAKSIFWDEPETLKEIEKLEANHGV